MTLELSVVICTHNRAALLPGALDSLSAQTLPRDRFEVIVVDNASTDETGDVFDSWRSRDAGPSRLVREERLGANIARNRGIEVAAAETIVFTDDDVRPEPGWLGALLAAFRDTDAAAIGGRILPAWEVPPPSWLHPRLLRLLAVFDPGDERQVIDQYPYLVSANLACRREVFARFGPFHPDLDRRGRSLLSAGDTELCHRIVRGGGVLLYEPSAVVRHWIPRERLRLSFLLRRSFDQGRSASRYGKITGVPPRRRPRLLMLVRTAADAIRSTLRVDAAAAVGTLSVLANHLGYLVEDRRP